MGVADILGSIDILATLVGTRVKVEITQTFTNQGKRAIEASYTFPVPPNAIVQNFNLTLGDRIVTSSIEETEKAYKAYDKAIKKGDTGAIIESIRKDILELSLGNIAPGEVAKVTLTYLQEIPETENKSKILMRIPLVVVPRYERKPTLENSRIQPNIGKNHTVVHLTVDIQEFSTIEQISSPSHRIQASIHGESATVKLALENEKADSDFVLEVTLKECPTSFTFSEDGFTLVQVTPTIDESNVTGKRLPTLYGFLLDHSGSMEGTKLLQAKQALKLCLRQLSVGDFFTIVAFDDMYKIFSDHPLPYQDDTMQKADEWIDTITADGGTEIFEPLQFLFKSLGKKGKGTILVFTDGQVSNEDQIINLVSENQEKMTVFPFGIDTAVNESFINGIASAGNGVSEFIYPGERMEDKVLRHFDRILSPSWENAILCGSDGEELEVVPRIPGKLFPRDTYSFLFKYDKGCPPSSITLKAILGDEKISYPIRKIKTKETNLPTWWALTKIRSLEKSLSLTNPRRHVALKKEIIELSLMYQVLSTFTSLLAVLPRDKKLKGTAEFIKIPVCAPRDWDMLKQGNIRKFSARKLSGFPEGEPMMSYAAPPSGLAMAIESDTAVLPIANKVVENKTREDMFRGVALQQKVSGVITRRGKEDLLATILFVLLFLQDIEASKTYRKSIQKACIYLLGQSTSEYSLMQACAFHNSIVAKLTDPKTTSEVIQKCLESITRSELEIYTHFTNGNPVPLWRKIDQKITGSDTWEEISVILLQKMI